jgi:c-di-GMP-binding flagellar brake protein YcgR
MIQGPERRQYLRAGLNVFINEADSTGDTIGRATDISESGMHFITPEGTPDREDEEIKVEFHLPGNGPTVKVQGRVVYENEGTHKHRTAIVFTQVDHHDAVRIHRYVVSRKRAEIFESLRQQHLLH